MTKKPLLLQMAEAKLEIKKYEEERAKKENEEKYERECAAFKNIYNAFCDVADLQVKSFRVHGLGDSPLKGALQDDLTSPRARRELRFWNCYGNRGMSLRAELDVNKVSCAIHYTRNGGDLDGIVVSEEEALNILAQYVANRIDGVLT